MVRATSTRKNQGVAAIKLAASNSPPDCCMEIVRVLLFFAKKREALSLPFLLVRATGLDKIKEWHRRAGASGAHPRRIEMVRVLLPAPTGLEPARSRSGT